MTKKEKEFKQRESRFNDFQLKLHRFLKSKLMYEREESIDLIETHKTDTMLQLLGSIKREIKEDPGINYLDLYIEEFKEYAKS